MILPLTNNPSESFNFTIDGSVYKFLQRWNTLGFWTLSIQDIDGNIFIHDVKLVTKENLLINYPHIPFDLRSERNIDPTRNILNQFNLEVIIKNV